LDIGQHLKDDHLCARASFALGLAHIQNLHMQEALESWQYALEAARQADDLLLQGFPLQRIPLGLILLGRFDEAEAVALEGCEVTRQIHDWGEYSLALSYQACVAVARGNFQAVERLAHETLFMVDRSGYPWSGARSLLALACARALCGAWSEAENALDRLVEPGRLFTDPGPYIVFAQAFRRLVRAHAGACNETIEPLVASLMQTVGTDTHSLAPLCALVELSDLMAAPAIAEPPFQALAMAVKRGIFFSSGWICLLPRVLGVAATLNGWWDKAESYFQMAIEAATHAGARPELGRTYLDHARMLAVRGGVNDHHRAMGFVIQAGSIFHDLGMIPFIQRAEQLREALQDRSLLAVLQPSSDLDHLSELEVEVYLRIAHEHINFLG
jgi:tetratricopeptide (TPR) repeat protein